MLEPIEDGRRIGATSAWSATDGNAFSMRIRTLPRGAPSAVGIPLRERRYYFVTLSLGGCYHLNGLLDPDSDLLLQRWCRSGKLYGIPFLGHESHAGFSPGCVGQVDLRGGAKAIESPTK